MTALPSDPDSLVVFSPGAFCARQDGFACNRDHDPARHYWAADRALCHGPGNLRPSPSTVATCHPIANSGRRRNQSGVSDQAPGTQSP